MRKPQPQGRTDFGQRLVDARLYAKKTQAQASKAAGMKSQSALSELEREGKGSSYTSALAALYGVDGVWLATGKGEMLPAHPANRGAPSDDERQAWMAAFDYIDDTERREIIERAEFRRWKLDQTSVAPKHPRTRIR